MKDLKALIFRGYLFSLLYQWAYSLSVITTGRNPIILRLNPYQFPTNNSSINNKQRFQSNFIKPIKTNPQWIQEVLGIRPNQNLTLNYDNFQELKHCGLFYNLTASTIIQDGQIFVEIYGYEMPSESFTPEVAVNDILDRIDFSGGLSYQNRNFLGRGQVVDFTLTSREGSKGLSQLSPSWRMQWMDSIIGKTSRISLGLEENNDLEKAAGLKLSSAESLELKKDHDIRTESRKIFGKFLTSTKDKKLRYELEPYTISVKQTDQEFDMYPLQLHGIKSTMNYLFRNHLFRIWHNNGFTKVMDSIKQTHSFRQLGLDYSSPMITLGSVKNRINFRKNANDTTIRMIDFLSRFQYKSKFNFGYGQVPRLHHCHISDSNLVRGTDDSVKLDESSHGYPKCVEYHVLKFDWICQGLLSFLSPGVFGDYGIYRESNHLSNYRHSITTGITLRSQGIRCDLAFQLYDRQKFIPRVYLSIDT